MSKEIPQKMTLTQLDVEHAKMRAFVNLAFEMGYFDYSYNKIPRSGNIA